jgi:hypothetical protein
MIRSNFNSLPLSALIVSVLSFPNLSVFCYPFFKLSTLDSSLSTFLFSSCSSAFICVQNFLFSAISCFSAFVVRSSWAKPLEIVILWTMYLFFIISLRSYLLIRGTDVPPKRDWNP